MYELIKIVLEELETILLDTKWAIADLFLSPEPLNKMVHLCEKLKSLNATHSTCMALQVQCL